MIDKDTKLNSDEWLAFVTKLNSDEWLAFVDFISYEFLRPEKYKDEFTVADLLSIYEDYRNIGNDEYEEKYYKFIANN